MLRFTYFICYNFTYLSRSLSFSHSLPNMFLLFPPKMINIDLNYIYRWHNMVLSEFDYRNGDCVTLKEFSTSSNNFTDVDHFGSSLYRA